MNPKNLLKKSIFRYLRSEIEQLNLYGIVKESMVIAVFRAYEPNVCYKITLQKISGTGFLDFSLYFCQAEV